MKRIGAIFPRETAEPKAEPSKPAKGKRTVKGKKEEKPCTPTMNTTTRSTGES